MQSAGTGLCTIIARDFVCQNRNPWSCAQDFFLSHPDCVSNGCDSALSWELFSYQGASSSGFPPKGWEMWLQTVLELLQSKPRKFWNPRNTRTSSCCFMNESKPVFFWEISCSLFCERFQQFRPYRVPMNCCIRLSFFLIIMTHQSCDHFGDRCWKRSSPTRWIGRNNFSTSFSVVGMVLLVYNYIGLEETLIESASSFLVCEWLATEAATGLPELVFECAKESSLSSAFAFSESNSALVRYVRHFGKCNSSTNRLFPLDIRTQDVRLGWSGDGIAISSPKLSRIFTMWTSTTGPTMYSLHIGIICPRASSSSGLVLLLIPADTLYQNDASSKTLVNWFVSDSDTMSWMFSHELFPDAGLAEDTKRFTSCEFTLFRIPFLVPSRLLSNYCSHQFRNCSVNTELIHKKNDSEQEFSVWSIRCFLESLFHLRRCWIPLSFRRVLCFSIPHLVISGTEERPVSMRKFLRVCLDFLWFSKYNSPSAESLLALSLTWRSAFWSDQKGKLLKWLQENIEKFIMLNKRRRWFHSSGASSARFNFFRKFLKTFSRYRWSEICILWNSNLVFPIWMSSPRSNFLVLAELADSRLRPSVLWLEDWVSSLCLSWEYGVGSWLLFRVIFLPPGETITLIQFLILRAVRSTRISRWSFLCTQEISWHQIHWSRFRHRRTFFRLAFRLHKKPSSQYRVCGSRLVQNKTGKEVTST